MSALIKGTRWVAVETLISRILQIAAALYVARVLGPEAMGTVALVQVALEIFRIFSEMGITQALVYHKEPTREQLSTLYTVSWILAGFIYLSVVTLAPLLAVFFDEKILEQLLPVAAFSIVVAALGQQILALLQKELNFKITAFISIIAALANAATSVTLVTLGFGIWSVVWGQVVGLSTRSCLAFFYGSRNNLFFGFGVHFKSVKPMLSFGLYQAGAMSINMVNSRADQVIIGKTMGVSALGIYSIGSQITLQAMQQINSIATRVAFPGISRRQDDVEEVKAIYLAMVANVLLVSAPLFIGLSVVSPIFVDVVLGEKWSGLSSVLSVLCIYALARSIGNMNGPLVLGLGKARWSFYWNLGLLVLMPGIIFFASRSGEIVIVAFMLLVVQLLLMVVSYFYWIKRLIGACAQEYMSAIARPVLSALLMAAIIVLVTHYFEWYSSVVTLVRQVILGIFSYCAFSLVLNSKNFTRFIINGLRR